MGAALRNHLAEGSHAYCIKQGEIRVSRALRVTSVTQLLHYSKSEHCGSLGGRRNLGSLISQVASLEGLTFPVSRGRRDDECVFNELTITTRTYTMSYFHIYFPFGIK